MITLNMSDYHFAKILSVMGIKNKKTKIKKDYDKSSIRNINKIKIYPNVITTINKLKKQKNIALFTSKDPKRTKLFMKKFHLQFDHIECGGKSIKGKPYPDQIRKILKKNLIVLKIKQFILVICTTII